MSVAGKRERKHYGQHCPVARALDLIGDRWTPLIVRELLGGPAHFGELVEGLPGIPRNLLSDRLKRLETDGIVRRANHQIGVQYMLTERGSAVRGPLEQLAFWASGLEPVATPVHDRSVRAIAMALHAVLSNQTLRSVGETLIVEIEVDGASIEVVLGPDPSAIVRPVVRSHAHVTTSRGALSRYLDEGQLRTEDLTLVSGEPDAVDTLLGALGVGSDGNEGRTG